jgi:Ni2+-binding GTPase involved in maturation of urease and hydrogenase
MALVTISGFPCSGKTTRVSQIADMLRARQSLPVITITDEDLNLTRDAYDSEWLAWVLVDGPARADGRKYGSRNFRKEC